MLEPIPQIAALALSALVAAAVLVPRRRLAHARPAHLPDLLWLLPAVSALSAVLAWCGGGLYESASDPLALALLCLAALLEGACALLRRPALDALDALPGADRPARTRREAIRAGIALVALLGSCALAWLSLELPWNPDLLQIDPSFSTFEVLLVLGALAFLYFSCQRRGAGMAVGVVALSLVGLAQFFVTRFKSASIMPADLLALGTAAEVSGGYAFSVDSSVVLGLACALVAVGLCAFVAPSRPSTPDGAFGNVMGNALAALAVASLLWSGVTADPGKTLGVEVDYWDSVGSYREHGFLPSFVKVTQDLSIDRPEGYSDAEAAELEARYAAAYDEDAEKGGRREAATRQFNEERPSIVCVMDESFADLSFLDGLGVGYEGPEFYASWPGAALRGDLAVSVQGGGTCNTEFEFLTGVSLAFVGGGSYPYTLYDLSDAPSLPRQLASLGYKTTAIHPGKATNWNRASVYEELGFDEFIDVEDFAGARQVHGTIADGAAFDRTLEVLEEGEGPQFVFCLTIQNHGSYLQANVDEALRPGYSVEGLTSNQIFALNEYLACVSSTDRDLERFVGQLAELDEPVVLVFFGDHQPNITPRLVDALYPGADRLENALRAHQSTYAVWANYPLASAAEDDGAQAAGVWDDASPAYLAAMVLDAIGAPLTDFQKVQLVARDELPAISTVGALLADGGWVADATASPRAAGAYEDLATITYLEFARAVE